MSLWVLSQMGVRIRSIFTINISISNSLDTDGSVEEEGWELNIITNILIL